MAYEEQDDLFGAFDAAHEGAFDAQLSLPMPFVHAPEPLRSVVKRDGREEVFDKRKIASAIFNAAQSIGGQDKDLAQSLASAVAIYLGKRMMGKTPNVDHVHDAVERVLVQMAHAKTALAYARYRDRRARIRRLRQGDLRALVGELEEARHEREALGGHGDDALFIRTSADTLITWDREKIVEALRRETQMDEGLAAIVAAEVQQQIERAGIRVLTTSLVRELVGAKLIEHGFEEFRDQHRRLGVPVYDSARIIRGATPDTLATDPVATDRVLAGAMKKEFALSEVFSPRVSEAHLRGEIHLHHLPLVDRLLRAELSLASVIRHGIGLPGRRPHAGAPAALDALFSHMMKATALHERYFAEALTWDAVNFLYAPFLQGADAETLKEFAEVLVYECAYRAHTKGGAASQTVFGLHWRTPPWLCEAQAIGPSGEPTGKRYNDFEPIAQQFAWAIVEVILDAGNEGARLAAPAPWIHIGPDFFAAPGHERFLSHCAEVAALRCPVRFVLNAQEEPTNTATPIERTRKVLFQQVTINLPRAAYAAGTPDALLDLIAKRVELAADAHQEKRDFLDGLLDPSGNGPLALLAAPRGEAEGICAEETIGLVAVEGLAECVEVLLGKPLHANEEGITLGEKILARLAACCAESGARRGLHLAPAENTDAGAGRRFATLDARDFPQTAAAVLKADPATEALEYTRGARIARGHGLNPVEGVRIEGRLHAHLPGQAASTVTLPEGDFSPDAISAFVQKACRQTAAQSLVFE